METLIEEKRNLIKNLLQKPAKDRIAYVCAVQIKRKPENLVLKDMAKNFIKAPEASTFPEDIESYGRIYDAGEAFWSPQTLKMLQNFADGKIPYNEVEILLKELD